MTDLDHNPITGYIPSEILHLSNLTSVALSKFEESSSDGCLLLTEFNLQYVFLKFVVSTTPFSRWYWHHGGRQQHILRYCNQPHSVSSKFQSPSVGWFRFQQWRGHMWMLLLQRILQSCWTSNRCYQIHSRRPRHSAALWGSGMGGIRWPSSLVDTRRERVRWRNWTIRVGRILLCSCWEYLF